jgi:hypothetical protein
MSSMARRSALIVFPALALAFSASCAAAGTAAESAGTSSAGFVAGGPTGSASSVSKAAVPSATALDLLGGIVVRKETPAGYARTKFKHWIDADGDSCNTREEVLIAESSSKAQVSYPGCKVIAGDWVSAYDGVAVTDPAGFDIDHFVPLKEAWDSGANVWSSARRQAFANDMSDARALIAVTASSNRSKGEKDPPQWMPSNSSYACTYLSNWVAVKSRWGLAMDQSEHGFIAKRLKGICAGTSAAPWGVADTPFGSGSSTTPPATSPGSGATGTTTAPAPDSTAPKGAVAATVTPGAFCAPTGATGYSSAGKKYVCSTTNASGTPYAGGRARWRAA